MAINLEMALTEEILFLLMALIKEILLIMVKSLRFVTYAVVYWIWAGLCYIGGSGGMSRPNLSTSNDLREHSAELPVAPLPSFSSGDVRDFFRRVRIVQEANRWDENIVLRLLPTKLSGPALAAFSGVSQGEISSLDAFEEFLDKSLNARVNSMEEFSRISFCPGETVDQYLLRLRHALQSAGLPDLAEPTRDALLCSQFTAGLPSSIRGKLLIQPSNMSLKDTMNGARRLLALEGRGSNSTSMSFEHRRREQNKRFHALPRRIADDQRYGRFQGSCFRCGRQGHKASQCMSGNDQGPFRPLAGQAQ